MVGGPFGSDLTRSDYIETPGVPVIRGTNLGGRESRFIDDGFVFVTPEKADSLRRNMAFPGDLIFTQRGTMGQVAIIPSNCKFPRYVISQSQMKLTPNVNRVDRLYLYHYLRSPLTLNRLLSQTQATGVPHINLGILRDFTVLLPPLPEQRRIAAILDQADGLRRKRQQALALTDQLATSMFREMFGNCDSRKGRWATSSVGNAVNLANGRAFKSSEWRKEGLPIIRIQNLKDADAEFNYFDGEFADQHFVEPGSLLIAWAGQLVSFGVHIWDGPPGLLNQHIFKVTPKGKYSLVFLQQALSEVIDRAKSQFHGIDMKHITKSDLVSHEFPNPPYEVQCKFEKGVSVAVSLRSRVFEATKRDAHLFESLVHRAFRGEL